MVRKIHLGRIACLLFLAIPAWAATGCEVSAPHADAGLDAALRNGAAKGLPGVSLAIGQAGKIIYTGQGGFADIESTQPVKPTSGFGVGSITKTFTAVVFLQLAREKGLDLSTTPQQLLGAAVVGQVPNANAATWLQVMNHTSGVPTWEFDPRWIRKGRGAEIEPDKHWKPLETLAYAMAPAHSPTTLPGQQYNYSNTNYTLIGLAIEKLSGHSYIEELHNRILKPMGLDHTYMDGFEEPNTPRAQGYHADTHTFEQNAGLAPSFKPVRPGLIKTGYATLSPSWSVGGMISTASDIACFGSKLRNDPPLQPEQRRIMFDFRLNDENSEVGRGIFRRKDGDIHLLYHSGGVLGYSAYFGWIEEQDVSFALLCNHGTMHAGTLDYTLGTLMREEQIVKKIRAYAELQAKQNRPAKPN